jgi:uncharacterized membrane protein YfcA
MKMTTETIIILALIGIGAGILSGFVGIGGGVVIVPALVYFLGLTQHQAQGTSLFVLAMPVVALAMMNYWKTGNVNWKFGLIIAITFFIGGFVGSKLALKLSPGLVKFIFGIIMAYVSVRLLLSGYQSFSNQE